MNAVAHPPVGHVLVVEEPRWVRPTTWLLGPLLGAGAGAALGWLVSEVVGARWLPIPFGRPISRAVRDVPDAWLQGGVVALGAAGGLALAWCVVRDLVRFTVSGHAVLIERAGRVRTVPAGDVSHVLLDGKELVLLGEDGGLLAGERTDLGAARLRDAFERAGLPWRDADPYDADFRRWVPGAYGLPPGAEPLLTARERALREWSTDDAAEFQRELARLGVVVRTRGCRQWWRLAGGKP